jgi:IPT/TIG domain
MKNPLGPLFSLHTNIVPSEAPEGHAALCPSRPRSSLRLCLPALAALVLLAPLAFAQAFPHIKAVDPNEGKVNDSVTLTGDHLGKDVVDAVFLSDAKTDHKGAIVEQSDEKIIMKVPQVKAGDYNVSVQSGGNILILPVRFKVEQ